MSKKFTHLDDKNQPQMVDVGDKEVTSRSARAQSTVVLPPEVLNLLDNEEISTKKGPVFQTAILAGIMAAKKTSDLIPLCHPLALNKCDVQIVVEGQKVLITSEVRCNGKTGVEMEALTGASVAALTIYDMCKAFSHDIVITDTRLLKKTGGKSDFEYKA
ncbi:MAG: cyclic pyranopterin monophosphate synthase MoaC [Bacteroidia bacterium]|nr:cyclic pyranopterin monophosphate synthase MoaC [Bacteroidia bacterium]